MGIIKGAISFGSNFNIGAAGPIDSRMRVETVADLTTVWSASTPAYAGMIVEVIATGDLYVLNTQNDKTATADAATSSNWKKVGDNSSVTADLNTVKQNVAANTEAIAKEVTDRKNAITDAIEALDATVEKSDKGVAVKIVETDGKLIPNSSSVTVTTGTIGGETDGNVVTGSVVKTYVDNQDATTLSAAKKYADEKVSSAYKIKGCKDNFTDLTETGNQSGDVWNIKNAFTLDGKPYPAGTNVVWVEAHTDGEDTDHASGWDALGGTINLEPYAKTDDINGSTTGTGVVRSVTLTGGKLTATASALTADDIPALTVSKISGLQTELDKKANDADVIKSGNNGYKTIILSGTTSKTQIDANGSITMASSQQSDDYNNVSISADRYGDAIAIYREKSSGSSELAPIRVAEPTDDSDAATKKYVDAVKTSTLQNAILKDGKSTIGEAELLLPTEKSFVIRDNADNSRVTFTPQEVEFINEAISLKADAGFDAITITASTNDAGNENGITLKTGDNDGPVKIHGIAVETDEYLIADTDAVNVGYVKEKIGQIDTGVTSFGGKTGAITVDGTGSSSYPVKLAMTGNKLGATVSGLGTAAAKAVGDFATAAQGTKADGAVQLGKENSSGENATSFVVDAVTDTGIIVKTKTGATVSSTAKLSPRMLQVGDGQASRLIPGALVLSNKEGEDVYISSASAGHITVLSGGSTNTTVIGGVATPTDGNDAANKAYVDSALTWEVL